MRTSAITEILAGVDRLGLSDADKCKVKNLVRDIGRKHGIKRIEQIERAEFAAALITARVSRTTIAERLKARYDISREQAYRDIRSALQLCQRSMQFDTASSHNEASNGDSSLPKE